MAISAPRRAGGGYRSPESPRNRRRDLLPGLIDAGITSIAIDASHLPDDENLRANLALAPYVPSWAGLETEVGEIKGAQGLSTAEEALFLVRGLNAHGFFPDWISARGPSRRWAAAEARAGRPPALGLAIASVVWLAYSRAALSPPRLREAEDGHLLAAIVCRGIEAELHRHELSGRTAGRRRAQ